MLSRPVCFHTELQQALAKDLPLQRRLLRPMLRLLFPPAAGSPEFLNWQGDVEDGSLMLACDGMPAHTPPASHIPPLPGDCLWPPAPDDRRVTKGWVE